MNKTKIYNPYLPTELKKVLPYLKIHEHYDSIGYTSVLMQVGEMVAQNPDEIMTAYAIYKIPHIKAWAKEHIGEIADIGDPFSIEQSILFYHNAATQWHKQSAMKHIADALSKTDKLAGLTFLHDNLASDALNVKIEALKILVDHYDFKDLNVIAKMVHENDEARVRMAACRALSVIGDIKGLPICADILRWSYSSRSPSATMLSAVTTMKNLIPTMKESFSLK